MIRVFLAVMVILTMPVLGGCGGAVDTGALLASAAGSLPCAVACVTCSTALAGTDAPAAEHVACAAHCAACAADMAGDMAEVAGDAEPEPLATAGPVCVDTSLTEEVDEAASVGDSEAPAPDE